MSVSFRDPGGQVFVRGARVIRALNSEGYSCFQRARQSKFLSSLVNQGLLVRAKEIQEPDDDNTVAEITEQYGTDQKPFVSFVEHEKIDLPSFPYEWSAEMLYEAATLTLDVAEALLNEGLGLKDATPYNILFNGPKPVFVDWLSFEERDPGDPVWLAEAQFLRTFVLPLLSHKNFNTPIDRIFLSSRDGLEPDELYDQCHALQRFYPSFLFPVSIPKWLSGSKRSSGNIYQKQRINDPEKARFILQRQFARLRRSLERVIPHLSRSDWAEYVGPKQHFTPAYFDHKEKLVSKYLNKADAMHVLDIGCNTGNFSRIACEAGARVVSVDSDSASVGRVWKMSKDKDLPILPLVIDFTRPTPGVGWRNSECPSFIDRITQKFDSVMMLAVVHHMMVSERIPLGEILDLVAQVTSKCLIIEYVPKDDPMFIQIARGRDNLFDFFSLEFFEAECRRYFQILDAETIVDSNRRLYLLSK